MRLRPRLVQILTAGAIVTVTAFSSSSLVRGAWEEIWHLASARTRARLRSVPSPCPAEMSLVRNTFCIDMYEASTVEVFPNGTTRPHSPFMPVDGMRVRAVSQRGVTPQGYISRNEAEVACQEAGKRLCSSEEWVEACQGPQKTRFPYGDNRIAGHCVDTGRVSPLMKIFGESRINYYQFEPMNDPRLNQVPGTLAPTGSFTRCTNGFRVYDMVGNLHEWTADRNGTFRGGYYLDTKLNGDGCQYRTIAHGPTYHDYSTGFRCCADPKFPAFAPASTAKAPSLPR